MIIGCMDRLCRSGPASAVSFLGSTWGCPMPIAVLCPSCQASLKVPDQMAGKQVKCPKCSQPIAAGRGGTTPAAPQTPAAAKIKVTCPACAKVLLAPAQAAGKAIKCPGCGKPVRVTGNGAAQPPAAPAKKLAVGAEAPPQVVAAKKTPPAKTSPEAPPTPNKDRAGTAGPG